MSACKMTRPTLFTSVEPRNQMGHFPYNRFAPPGLHGPNQELRVTDLTRSKEVKFTPKREINPQEQWQTITMQKARNWNLRLQKSMAWKGK